MIKKYFTKKGVSQVIEKYEHLIDNLFFFNDPKTNNKRHKLRYIVKKKTNYSNGFLILFTDGKLLSITIDDFMEYNKLEYDFGEFESISVE